MDPEPRSRESLPTRHSARKLFVGQIPFTMEQPELKEVMSEFGKVVDMMILRDRMSGTHKGCAFVRFELEAEANLALESLHGKRKLANVRVLATTPRLRLWRLAVSLCYNLSPRPKLSRRCYLRLAARNVHASPVRRQQHRRQARAARGRRRRRRRPFMQPSAQAQ